MKISTYGGVRFQDIKFFWVKDVFRLLPTSELHNGIYQKKPPFEDSIG